MNENKEQRNDPRIDFHLPVMIKGQKGLVKVLDLSLSGLFIEVRDASKFKPGDEIELVMKLPQEKSSILVKTRVARVTAQGIGVNFQDLTPKQQMSLEYCFHIFKSTVPFPSG
jgi:Tfp pilus assembly protein PilZ